MNSNLLFELQGWAQGEGISCSISGPDTEGGVYGKGSWREKERKREREREGEKKRQTYKTQGNQDHAVQNCYSCFCFYWLALLASLLQQLWFI